MDAAQWAASAHVACAHECYSVLSRGVYARRLKLPMTPEGATCLERHRLYAAAKYRNLEMPVIAPGGETMQRGVVFAGTGSHWHFLIDGLGQMHAPDRPECCETLYLDADVSPEQERFVLAFAREARFAPFARVERISGAWLPFTDCAFACRHRITDEVAWLRSVLHVAATGRRRRLFVARNGAAIRRLVNQGDVAAALRERLGFELVDPAAMTLDEQVCAFRDADVIVGPHGGGLANAVFAGRLRLLVEFFHTQPQLFYHSLAFALGAHHYTIKARPVMDTDGDPRGHNADYAVDPREAVAILELLLARHA